MTRLAPRSVCHGPRPHKTARRMHAFAPIPLGTPIPDSPHAVSCSLPTMTAVRGYEEKDPAVVGRLRSGYPRFLVHPFSRRLASALAARHGLAGRTLWLASSRRMAGALLAHLQSAGGAGAALFAGDGVHGVSHPESPELARSAKLYLQNVGGVISSREAEDRLAAMGAGHIYYPERAGARRMRIHVRGTGQVAALVWRGNRALVPRVAPRIQPPIRAFGRVLPFPLVRQPLACPGGVSPRVFYRHPGDRLIRPTIRVRFVAPVLQEVVSVFRMILRGVQKLLEVRISHRITVDVDRFHRERMVVAAAGRVFPRILHVQPDPV